MFKTLFYIALFLPAVVTTVTADPLQPFLTEYWSRIESADALIRPLDPRDITNHCPLGGIYRPETKDCLRWFSPGCGLDGGILNLTTNRCRRRFSPQWNLSVNSSDPTLGTQICIAAGGGPLWRLVLNATAAAQRKTSALRCIGRREDVSSMVSLNTGDAHVLSASIGGSLGAFFSILLLGGVLNSFRPKKSKETPLRQDMQSPLHVTRTQPFASSLTFYKLQPRSASAASSVAITIQEQRNTFQPTQTRRHK